MGLSKFAKNLKLAKFLKIEKFRTNIGRGTWVDRPTSLRGSRWPSDDPTLTRRRRVLPPSESDELLVSEVGRKTFVIFMIQERRI